MRAHASASFSMYAKLELSLSPGRSSISVTIPTEPATAGLTTGGGAAAGALVGLPWEACQANAMASRGGRCWAQRRALGDHNSGRQVVGVCFNAMHLTTETCVHPAICNQALCMCASEACFSASVRLPDQRSHVRIVPIHVGCSPQLMSSAVHIQNNTHDRPLPP